MIRGKNNNKIEPRWKHKVLWESNPEIPRYLKNRWNQYGQNQQEPIRSSSECGKTMLNIHKEINKVSNE